jgi:hypothetical protein
MLVPGAIHTVIESAFASEAKTRRGLAAIVTTALSPAEANLRNWYRP